MEHSSHGSVTNWHAYVGMHCVADLDADGTVHALADETGSIIESYSYEAAGINIR